MDISSDLVRLSNMSRAVLLPVAAWLLASCSVTPPISDPSSVPKLKSPSSESTPGAKKKRRVAKVHKGKASFYSVRTNGGRQTASGERLRNDAATAAHRSLPFGTRVRVTNLRNGRSAVVRINDRGPFIKGRIIDVTISVARQLQMVSAGVVPCTIEVLAKG